MVISFKSKRLYCCSSTFVAKYRLLFFYPDTGGVKIGYQLAALTTDGHMLGMSEAI